MDYREKSLRNLAAQRSYEFSPTDTFGIRQQTRDFRLTTKGRATTIKNVLRAQDDMLENTAYVFDLSYDKSTDRDGVHQTVLYLQSPQLVLPELIMQPETVVHKLGELFGFGDIDFVRFPKFSSQYRLTGDDEVFIRHHFTDTVLNYFTLNKGWTLEGLGYYLLLYKKGVLLPPAEIQHLFWRAYRIADLLSKQVG